MTRHIPTAGEARGVVLFLVAVFVTLFGGALAYALITTGGV